ncbi:hypothetical protein [Microbacterium sp. WCS2018Hpa-9]|uniref:hypothetical protein n=1 Tax=Microbacterium sp. WCS2018Hpa-9 TaxID=3073635 RepID=UPI00288BF87F|nr:hypothetical protein [Microbacterium sp. WCS2018Hpa-9]
MMSSAYFSGFAASPGLALVRAGRLRPVPGTASDAGLDAPRILRLWRRVGLWGPKL